MSSRDGAGSGDKDGTVRESKRAKNETPEQIQKKAYIRAYYPRNPEFPDVDERQPWVKPPILVFFNAKGGTLKTSHTWTTAHIMSSKLRGLKVGKGFLGIVYILRAPLHSTCLGSIRCREHGKGEKAGREAEPSYLSLAMS